MQPEDFFLLGLSIARQGNEDLALEVWTKAATEPPDQPELLLSLANLLARRQRFDESAALAQRLASIPGWEAAGLLNLGANRFSLEDYPAAVKALEEGLRADPEAARSPLDASVYRKLLARCLLTLGRPAEADRWLDQGSNTSEAAPDPEAAWLASRSALQQGQLERAKVALVRAGTYRADNPLVPEPSPYIGSAKCAPCHAEISRNHERARHARTFHHGAGLLKLPRPEGSLTDPDDPKVTHSFLQDGKKLKMQTRIDDRLFETLVDYAFGTTDRYFSLVGRDGNGGYRALRKSYFHDAKGSGWDRTAGDAGHTDRFEQARGQLIQVRDGVVRCLHCHVTNPREFRDPDHDGSGPETADAGIGCERCHGPGANHVAAVAADLSDRAIVSASRDAGDAVNIQCRACHIVGDATEIDHHREDPIWVRSPGATMNFSRCYTESSGALTCLTCHDPHRDSERSASFHERKCLGCHSTPTSPGLATEKQVKAPILCKVNPTTGCVGCHMPKVPMPVLHTSLTDHFIRVHREKQPSK